MAGEDLIVPTPPLGPDDLGLSAPPMAPAMPVSSQAPDDFKSKLMKLLAIGVAGGLGPGTGTGVLQGMAHADQQKAAERQRTDQIARQTYQQQQTDYEQQQRLFAQQAQQRQQTLQTNVEALRRVAPTLKTKADYDSYVEAYANGLQSMGLRITPNWLRQAVPYVAPSAKDRAAKFIDDFMKIPTNAELLKNHPEQLPQMMGRFDRDGDGIAELMPISQIATIGERPFASDASGKLIVYPKGTTEDVKVGAQGYYDIDVRQAQAEGKQLTPELQKTFMDQALARAKKAGATPATGGESDTLGGLTPEGVEYAATQYRITGVMPPMGMGKTPARPAIINAAAEQVRILGQSPAVAIQKQAAYKSDGSALTRMRTMSASAEAFETKADAQADIVKDLSSRVNRTQYPIINDGLLTFKARVGGDQNTQLLFNALTTFTTEYAKIMEGATGSAAGSSISARQQAAQLVSAGLAKGTLAATIDLMQREMRLTVQGYDATIAHITKNMGGVAPPTVQSAAPAVEEWVRDPSGKLVKKVP